jgi:hypothetical protein
MQNDANDGRIFKLLRTGQPAVKLLTIDIHKITMKRDARVVTKNEHSLHISDRLYKVLKTTHDDFELRVLLVMMF